MTFSEEILNGVMDAAAAHQNGRGADLVGINMEGPFISPNKVGAQNPEYLHKADVAMFRRLQKRANGLIKLVDIAPEEPGALEFIAACHDEVRISIAHTCTSYDTANAAFDAGATHMTHLYNAMPGITHREPGPIIAALERGAEVELITDNVHIHPAMVRFTFNTFGDDHVILIADSMMACGLPDGQYSLGGQAVTVSGPRATLTEHPGTIAGSATCLYDCMKRAVLEMNVPLESAVRAASENPAKMCIRDRDDSVPQLAPHHAGKMMGIGPPQGGGAIGDFGCKITVRHRFSLGTKPLSLAYARQVRVAAPSIHLVL